MGQLAALRSDLASYVNQSIAVPRWGVAEGILTRAFAHAVDAGDLSWPDAEILLRRAVGEVLRAPDGWLSYDG